MTILKTIVFASGLLVVGFSLHPPALLPREIPPKDQAIRLSVEMVSLPVVVTTREGKRILDLHKEDFQVFEDGVVQEIAGFGVTDEPLSVALALDLSGSVAGWLTQIQDDAIYFVNLLNPDDSVAVMSFAGDVRLLEDWSIDRQRNARGINAARHGSCTKLFEAVWLAFDEVLKPISERTALVLFSDGVDSASHKASREDTVELARETRATVYPIYFKPKFQPPAGQAGRSRVPGTPPIVFPPTPPPACPGGVNLNFLMRGRKYLVELAELTGGKVVDAQQLQDLRPAFEEIAKELSSQYSIGYYSTNKSHDGKFRRVEVRLRQRNLITRTKKGYYAPKEKSREPAGATGLGGGGGWTH
jgi:Ca-activated chloride channel family protein